MTRSAIAGVLFLAAGLAGCDKIPASIPFIGRKAEPPPVVAAKPDSTPRAPAPVEAPKVVESRPVAVSMSDEPWTPVDTGTVNPGMTRDEVVALWGVPIAERVRGGDGYLYFRNGCERSCGTFDAVFLENGQVVDAIVRGTGHTYTGNSSSPMGRKPEATLPGTTNLIIPADSPAPAPAVAPAPGEDE